MSTTVLGYNRDPSTGAAVQIVGAGVDLVDKDGNALVLPAGHVVVEVRLKHVETTANPSADVEVLCDGASGTLLDGAAADLIANDHLSVVGAGTVSAPALAKTADAALKIQAAGADLADNGCTLCVVLKHKPMPTL